MRTDWTAEEIKNIILRNDRQLCLSIVQIYNCQTEDEKLYKETSHDNGIGFNAFDSEILSSFAEQYLKRGSLSKRQLEIAKKKMPKYSKQLAVLANKQALKALSKQDLENFND
jgi:hypothetical protein